jgi:hypothetical protein
MHDVACGVLIKGMFFQSVLQARLVHTTDMVDCRCPVRLQTQVTGEDAGTDSVGDGFIMDAEI